MSFESLLFKGGEHRTQLSTERCDAMTLLGCIIREFASYGCWHIVPSRRIMSVRPSVRPSLCHDIIPRRSLDRMEQKDKKIPSGERNGMEWNGIHGTPSAWPKCTVHCSTAGPCCCLTPLLLACFLAVPSLFFPHDLLYCTELNCTVYSK
jgi:hypothetical protein